MTDPSEVTTVSVYEAPTEAAARELLARDTPAMALRGWVFWRQRWAGPPAPTPARETRGAAAVLATLARHLTRHRELGSLWVVWRQVPIRVGEPELVDGALNPGGYCRRCGEPREVGAVACANCGLEAHVPWVGSSR